MTQDNVPKSVNCHEQIREVKEHLQEWRVLDTPFLYARFLFEQVLHNDLEAVRLTAMFREKSVT